MPGAWFGSYIFTVGEKLSQALHIHRTSNVQYVTKICLVKGLWKEDLLGEVEVLRAVDVRAATIYSGP